MRTPNANFFNNLKIKIPAVSHGVYVCFVDLIVLRRRNIVNVRDVLIAHAAVHFYTHIVYFGVVFFAETSLAVLHIAVLALVLFHELVHNALRHGKPAVSAL